MQKEFNNGQPERQGDEKNYQKYLDRVERHARRDRAQADRRRRAPARDQEAAAAAAAVIAPASPPAPTSQAAAQAALDLLATMVAVVTPEGECEFVNSSFETVLGLSRRSMTRGVVFDWFVDPQVLRETVAAVSNNAFSTSRLETVPEAPLGRRVAARARHRQPDRRLAQRRLRDRRDRAAEPPGARGARARAGRGDQGADQEPRPRDQEPARRHPRRRAAARDGDRVAPAHRVHPGDHQGGRPAAAARRSPARAAPEAPRRRQRQHPRGVRAGSRADRRRVPARPGDAARLRHLDSRNSAATASSSSRRCSTSPATPPSRSPR